MFPFYLNCETKKKASLVTAQKKEVSIEAPHVPSDKLFSIPEQFPALDHVSFISYIQLSCQWDKWQDQNKRVNNEEKQVVLQYKEELSNNR